MLKSIQRQEKVASDVSSRPHTKLDHKMLYMKDKLLCQVTFTLKVFRPRQTPQKR